MTENINKGGRPRFPANVVSSQPLNIKMTIAQKKKLVRLARKSKMSYAGWLKARIDEAEV